MARSRKKNPDKDFKNAVRMYNRYKNDMAFIVWALGSSRNRTNWVQTTLKHSRNLLQHIATLALKRRRIPKNKSKRKSINMAGTNVACMAFNIDNSSSFCYVDRSFVIENPCSSLSNRVMQCPKASCKNLYFATRASAWGRQSSVDFHERQKVQTADYVGPTRVGEETCARIGKQPWFRIILFSS